MSKSYSNGAWSVRTNKGTILDANSMAAAEERLQIPVPEMIFGQSEITVKHESGWQLTFNGLDALDLVDKTGNKSGLLQVAYSEEWRKSRENNSHGHDVSKIHRPFDWTYSTDYKGTETPQKLVENADAAIPFEKLKQQKPIALFDEVPLYEDELGDNGMVTFSGKIRVMEDDMLILVRMYLRVDDVVFRIRDTRVYIDFQTGHVIRSYIEKEDTFKNVRKRVPLGSTDHTQLLRDPNWIDSVLPTTKTMTYDCKL